MKPFRHATELLALFAIVIAGHASAQSFVTSSSSVNGAIDRWSKEKGVVVTKDVREQLARNLAIEFATGAPGVGLKTADAWRLDGAIADGGTVESTSRGKYITMMGRSDTGKFIASAQVSPPVASQPTPSIREVNNPSQFWEGLLRCPRLT